QWAMDRQSLLDQHESLKQGQQDLQQSHDQAKVELARLKDDTARAKVRDEERRGQLRQLEQERIQLAQKSEGDQKKIRADLKAAQDDLDSLQSAQLQWAMDRETLLKDRDTAVTKQAQLEQEWQKARAELTKDKARLTDVTTQVQQQLKAAQAELEPLKAAREKWQAERQRLVADVARLEQGSQAAEAQFRADRKLLQGQLEEARRKAADLDKAEAEFARISDERSALLTKVKALEKDWQSREASIAEEKAALKAQLDEARKAAGSGPPSSQVLARYEAEKRAMQAQLDSLRTELTASGKNKDAAPALAQAKRDFEAKFRVIYDQSHDLNSPLNAINGFSEILLDEKGNKTTPEERREFVAHINESAKRLGEHIRELIEFAKQEAGIQERPVQMMPPVGSGSKPPVILVADNDPAVKERIEPFLSHAGYEVVIAASAQEAR